MSNLNKLLFLLAKSQEVRRLLEIRDSLGEGVAAGLGNSNIKAFFFLKL